MNSIILYVRSTCTCIYMYYNLLSGAGYIDAYTVSNTLHLTITIHSPTVEDNGRRTQQPHSEIHGLSRV